MQESFDEESSLPASTGVELGAALSAAALLSACGGGGGGEAGAPAPAPAPPPPAPPTEAQASRFLAQAGFAALPADIAAVQANGYAAWLDAELSRPQQGLGRYQWMQERGFAVEANINSFAGADSAIWAKLIGSPDQVRQRMTLALSEIFVSSMLGLPISWRGLTITHYVDLLERNAFGNFRQLLKDVTLSVAMGSYLNMLGNRKEDIRTGRVPDENYARELMQLFTIGLYQLNGDGSIKRDGNGQPLETYTQNDISQLARVFTGWERDRTADLIAADAAYVTRPMKHNPQQYQAGDKTVLGTTIPGTATGPQALDQVLDLLAAHPNVGPFIGRQLIQRFTQSHPSPAYVARVAAVFDNNGSGQRGDLKAVLRAVLLDPEARAEPSGNASGRLREPVQRLVQWARSFGVRSNAGTWPIGDTSDPATRLGQSPLRSPSVFNFFRPGYVPPGAELAAAGITVPEFQLLNESTVAGYLNYLQNVIANGFGSGDTVADYTAELALASDATALLRHLNLRLAAGAIPEGTLSELATAVGNISSASDAGKLNRVRAGILLVMASPDYLIQR